MVSNVNAVIVFLSETDFLFKSASTPCGENSQIAIRKRPGITIQENLFPNGPSIQENLFSNGPSIQKCYSHTGMHMGIRAYYDIPKGFGEPYQNPDLGILKFPKWAYWSRKSSQSLHRLLGEWETSQNPDYLGKSKNWRQTYDPEMSKSNMDCWGNQAKIRII